MFDQRKIIETPRDLIISLLDLILGRLAIATAKIYNICNILEMFPTVTIARAVTNISLSGNLGNGEKIVCEMKELFTIAYIQ